MRRAPSDGKRRFSYFFLCLFLIHPALTWAEGLSLSASEEVSTGGYYQLEWEGGAETGQFQLQESQTADFLQAREVYQGPQAASVISGRGDGEYYYRIRQLDDAGETISSWSEPLKVTVEHHPLARAFIFFTIGLVVFAATLAAIMRGSKQHVS